MRSSAGSGLIKALEDRYGIQLNMIDWDVFECEGGIALAPELVDSLRVAAMRFGDESVTAYEMESLHKEFQPLRVPLSRDGIRTIRDNLMSHFDLIILPDSLRWAVAATNELEAFIFGPKDFVAAVSLGKK